MTDDLKTPLPVAGYTPQSDARIALVNEFKQDEERLLRKLDGMSVKAIAPLEWRDASVIECEPRFVAIARTHFQEGFMALNRAVFQPQRIKLPEDESK